MASLYYWKNKGVLAATRRAHHMGRWIHWPPIKPAHTNGEPNQRGLTICANCEATLLLDISQEGSNRLTGTALKYRCPYRYTPAELAAIDAANPVTKETTDAEMS